MSAQNACSPISDIQWDLNNEHLNLVKIFYFFAIQILVILTLKGHPFSMARIPTKKHYMPVEPDPNPVAGNRGAPAIHDTAAVHYSSHDLNNGPFKDQTGLDHSNTELVFHSDLHCNIFGLMIFIYSAVRF